MGEGEGDIHKFCSTSFLPLLLAVFFPRQLVEREGGGRGARSPAEENLGSTRAGP